MKPYYVSEYEGKTNHLGALECFIVRSLKQIPKQSAVIQRLVVMCQDASPHTVRARLSELVRDGYVVRLVPEVKQ